MKASEKGRSLSLLFLALVMASLSGFAQVPVKVERSSSTQVISGVEYFLHNVEQGQTLWAITRAYKCTEEQIKQSNPEYDGTLRIGQILKIPKEVKTGRKAAKQEDKIHVVQRGETMYGIARQYNTSVDSIISWNKLTSESLKPGQEIKIPPRADLLVPAVVSISPGQKAVSQPLADKRDTSRTLIHNVVAGETIYGISRRYGVTEKEILDLNPSAHAGLQPGMFLRIPDVKGMAVQTQPPVPSVTPIKSSDCKKTAPAVYTVAVLLPLFSNEVEHITIQLDDIKPPSAFRSFDFIQFYEGMLLAFDELKKKGVNLKIRVYDTYRSVDVVTNILKKPELLSADMIIGPFYSHEEGPVIEFSKTNGIIHISPFSNINGKVNDNPNCIRLQPSFRNQLQGMIDFAADSLVNPNIIVVHNKAEEEQETLAGIQQNIADVLKSKGIGRSSYKEINYKEGGYSALVSAFSATQPNVIITLMRGEAFVASYLTSLNKIRDKYDLYVVVNPQWMAYNNVDLNHLVNLKGIGYSAHFIDYGDEATKDFIRSFRERYKTEPDPYAFQGYDIAWFFLSGLSEYGKGFIHCLNTLDYSTMHTHYSFEQSTTGGGFENSTVNVFLYQDYKLVLKYRR